MRERGGKMGNMGREGKYENFVHAKCALLREGRREARVWEWRSMG